MAITLVINNEEDLAKAITKGIIFSGVTLFLIMCALVSAILIAIHTSDEEFNDVGPFILLVSPFILQGLQLVTTMFILHAAKNNTERLSMTKCRLWSVTARILAAPILIEMMILIGFKWYLTIIAIPLVIMYFLTMLQVEKIIHYFFTRNFFTRIAHQGGGAGAANLFLLDYPYNNGRPPSHVAAANAATSSAAAFQAVLLAASVPQRRYHFPIYRAVAPPTYNEAMAVGGVNLADGRGQLPLCPSSSSLLNDPPPPPYEEAIKIISAAHYSSDTDTGDKSRQP